MSQLFNIYIYIIIYLNIYIYTHTVYNCALRVSCGKKRVGRPRQNWLHYAKQHTFEHILGGYDYTETVAEDSRIYNAALTRTF